MSTELDPLVDLVVLHSYEKHHKRENRFNDEGLGVPLGINSLESFRAHIIDVLKSPETWGFRTHNQREVYFNRATNTVVILNEALDPKTGKPYGGSAWREYDFEGEFGRLYNKEFEYLKNNGKLHLMPDVWIGGYRALHPEGSPDARLGLKIDCIHEKKIQLKSEP